jgi:glycine/D-amino acid oxidase-like deaminating enzyme
MIEPPWLAASVLHICEDILMPATPNLPTPDFTFDPNAPGSCVAGVRPYRTGAYRLETEIASGKFLVHNYGHGGAGITLSWGCATKVCDIVQQHLTTSHDTAAAVLGAGVMGLTAATLLADLGLKVTIYSDRQPVATTSFKAGGQWAVSVIEFNGKEKELGEIVRTAYTTFKNSIGKGFGVSARPNYTAGRSENLEAVLKLAPGLIPQPVQLPRMPFEGHTGPGFEYQTLLIEPPIFLPRLQADLNARGVVIVAKKFAGKPDVLALTENIIVNCTGLGAMTLFDDRHMVPTKGQLAMLPAQPNLQYLYGEHGYMFPRADHLVIGGTYESGVNDEIPDKAACRHLVDVIASQFGKGPAVALADIHIHHPNHAAAVKPTVRAG